MQTLLFLKKNRDTRRQAKRLINLVQWRQKRPAQEQNESFYAAFSKSGFLLIHPQAVGFAPWRLDAQAYIRASNQSR